MKMNGVSGLRHRLHVEPAETCLLADQGFPELEPCAARRAHEGTVIEAHRHEAAKRVEYGVTIIGEAAIDVLPAHHHAISQRRQPRIHIGFAGKLHEGIGVAAGQRMDAARAVILERAGQQQLAIGGEGAGDGVAGMAFEAPALEAEAQPA